MIIKKKIFLRESHDFNHITFYNRGVLEDALNFNLVAVEKNGGLKKSSLRFLKKPGIIAGRIFYRLYLIIFFGIYFIIFCLGLLFKKMIQPLLRLNRKDFGISSVNESGLVKSINYKS